MGAAEPLPLLRLRISCADRGEYGATRAADVAEKGVLIRSSRPRSPGDRVRLEIELLDGSLAYAGRAVVRGAAEGESGATGYWIALDDAAPSQDTTPPAVPLAPQRDLGEYLFADLPGDAPEAGGGEQLTPTPSPVAASPAPAPDEVTPAPVRARSAVDEPPPAPAPQADLTPAPPVPALTASDLFPAEEPPGAVIDLEGDRVEVLPAPTPTPVPLAVRGPERGTRPALTRRGRLAIAGAALTALALLAGGVLVHAARARAARDAALAAELAQADARLKDGQLARPRGDSALDHLEAARRLVPGDDRVQRRLALLATTFEELGERALARAHVDEARAHFQAALRADPDRAPVRERLQRLDTAPPDPGGGR